MRQPIGGGGEARFPCWGQTFSALVMPGLVPGIHAPPRQQNVDGRDKPGHDGERSYSRNSLVSSPMPSIATVTMFTGSFITPTPTEVPTAMRSPGSRVMSWEILLTSSCAVKIMSDIG